MIPEDTLDAVMAVMEAGFDPHWREAWTRAQVRDTLELPSGALLLVDATGRPVSSGAAAGFVLSRQALDEEELLLIAVHPEHRCRGLGASLIARHVEAVRKRGVRKIFLEVRANNPAQSLYRRSGYVPIGVRPRYYRTTGGEFLDAITFARHV